VLPSSEACRSARVCRARPTVPRKRDSAPTFLGMHGLATGAYRCAMAGGLPRSYCSMFPNGWPGTGLSVSPADQAIRKSCDSVVPEAILVRRPSLRSLADGRDGSLQGKANRSSAAWLRMRYQRRASRPSAMASGWRKRSFGSSEGSKIRIPWSPWRTSARHGFQSGRLLR
jgi:hypothetical protein